MRFGKGRWMKPDLATKLRIPRWFRMKGSKGRLLLRGQNASRSLWQLLRNRSQSLRNHFLGRKKRSSISTFGKARYKMAKSKESSFRSPTVQLQSLPHQNLATRQHLSKLRRKCFKWSIRASGFSNLVQNKQKRRIRKAAQELENPKEKSWLFWRIQSKTTNL